MMVLQLHTAQATRCSTRRDADAAGAVTLAEKGAACDEIWGAFGELQRLQEHCCVLLSASLQTSDPSQQLRTRR